MLFTRFSIDRWDLSNAHFLAYRLSYRRTLWTEPRIHDVGVTLEVIIWHTASLSLTRAMGGDLESWPDGPETRRADSEISDNEDSFQWRD